MNGESPRPSAPGPGPVDHSSAIRRRRFGQRLGRYCLGPLIGSGGAASVYMARLDGPRGFERVLALKLVHEHLLADRDFVAMFLDEANLASRLQHPNIVHGYELGQEDECLFFAMEYLQGQPLSRIYQRARQRNQPLPYSLVAWLGARAADALAYAHGATSADGEPLHIVHRDVSPDNLFITYDGQVKLLDFGIAHAARRLAQTNLGQIKGKLRYMAPEYTAGQEVDGALDIFALGATLYEAAVGLPAFEGDEQVVMRRILLGQVRDPRELRPDFPAALWAVLEQMLAPKPELRLGPAAAAARALDAVAAMSPAQGRALLSLTLSRLFSEDQVAETRDLSELLARSSGENTEHGHAVSGHRVASRRSDLTKGLLVGASLLAVAGGLAARGLTHRSSPPPASARAATVASPPPESVPSLAPASSVDIGVVLSPPGLANVIIEIAGVAVAAAEPHRALPRSASPVSVRVAAPGYQSIEVSVAPDRDRFVGLTLTPVPAAGAPAALPAAKAGPSTPLGPSPDRSGVIKRYPF